MPSPLRCRARYGCQARYGRRARYGAEPVTVVKHVTVVEPVTVVESATVVKPVTVAEPATVVEPVTVSEPVTVADGRRARYSARCARAYVESYSIILEHFRAVLDETKMMGQLIVKKHRGRRRGTVCHCGHCGGTVVIAVPLWWSQSATVVH